MHSFSQKRPKIDLKKQRSELVIISSQRSLPKFGKRSNIYLRLQR